MTLRLWLILPLLAFSGLAAGREPEPPTPASIAALAQAMLEARLAAHDAEDGSPSNPNPGEEGSPNAAQPEYNPADALATDCFSNQACKTCMQEAIDVSNDAYEALAKNHAWKKWVTTEYKRMDGLASAVSSLNKYSKTAYAFQKSRVILPAKKSYEDKVKAAQKTTLNSLKSAFEKIGRCEAEHLGADNFTTIALMSWQIVKVKYGD